MHKIAIISDIHGNLEALKSVLKDIKERDVTEIYCLGDIIHKGVHGKECIELIKNNCKIVLKGNSDDYFTKDYDLSKINDETEKMRINWNRDMLTDKEREYLQSLPLCYEFYLSGRLVRLFHATQNNPYDKIGFFDDINTKYNMFLPSKYTPTDNIADIVVYGHIHTQLLEQRYNKTLLNCGSVGNSIDYIRNDLKDSSDKNTTNAQYLILEGTLDKKDYNDPINFEFVRVPYDINKELDNNLFNPEKEEYIYELTKGKYREIHNTYQDFKNKGINIDEI